MAKILIKGATLVNEGTMQRADVLIAQGIIEKIEKEIEAPPHSEVIHAEGLYLLPGMIDDQVHFREPGHTHKGNIETESRAALAGGVTSFMEMPNTIPNTLTQDLLEEKYQRAAETSRVNYSFYIGASNDNLNEVVKTNPRNVCGVKVFMGSSTGNMLVDNQATLEGIFKESPTLVASHCEDEATIRANLEIFTSKYGADIPVSAHPLIRSAEACYRSSSKAIELATRFDARLHILHISTAREIALFSNAIPLADKRITAEACVHHLWFTDTDYDQKGNLIKWNPAVKTLKDREAIRAAIKNNTIDVIATDHAPHTAAEKNNAYINAPSGGPLVQHALLALLELYHRGVFTLETIVKKTSHDVATLFEIENRGFIKEGYAADLVLVHLNSTYQVDSSNIRYKCGWSPFEGFQFQSKIKYTLVNGVVGYRDGEINDAIRGKRLTFDR